MLEPELLPQLVASVELLTEGLRLQHQMIVALQGRVAALEAPVRPMDVDAPSWAGTEDHGG